MLDKTNYPFEITDDRVILFDLNESEFTLVEECFSRIYQSSKSDIRFIKKALTENNHIPQLYNAMAIAYGSRGENAMADEVNSKVYKRFPNYLYAKLNMVHQLTSEGKLDEAIDLIGGYENMHINELYTDRHVFHRTEVVSFYSTAGRCQALRGDLDAAEKTLNDLLEICEDDDPVLEPLVGALIGGRAKLRHKDMEEEMMWSRQVLSFPTVNFKPTIVRPDLHHSELEIFYSLARKELTETQIKEIINLPRHTLIDDLILILRDSIERYDYLYDNDEWEECTHSFMIHAMYFLGALKAEEALDDVLNMLRQGEAFHEYWLGDEIEHICLPALYDMGRNSLSQLGDFVKETNISPYAKLLVSDTVSQLALNDQGRREEVISWYRDIIDYYKWHQQHDTIFDTTFLSFMVGDLMDMRATELIDVIEWMYDHHWLMPTIIGLKNEIIEEIKLPFNPANCKPRPINIYEYYNLDYQKRRQTSNVNYGGFNKILESKASQLIVKKIIDVLHDSEDSPPEEPTWELPKGDHLYNNTDEEYPATYVRSEAKVGRNDPCPCGSHKKYKKCCLKSTSDNPLTLIRNTP